MLSAYCLLAVSAYSLLLTAYCLLAVPAYSSLLTAYCLLAVPAYSLLPYCIPPFPFPPAVPLLDKCHDRRNGHHG